MACIMDDFTLGSYQPEARVAPVDPEPLAGRTGGRYA